MASATYISIEQAATHYGVEVSFLHSPHDYGLLLLESHEPEGVYIPEDRLADMERYLRLHTDLGINLEGLDAIQSLLERMELLQHELTAMRRRLARYE